MLLNTLFVAWFEAGVGLDRALLSISMPSHSIRGYEEIGQCRPEVSMPHFVVWR